MVRLPPLNALKCFEAAARLKSFSRAADELNVTQSAVSHQIRQLEDWFGAALFDRQGRETVATARAQDFAAVLEDAFGAIATASKRLKQPDQGLTLTIAAIPSIATIWLIPRLAEFLREHPEISVKVVYAFHGHALDFGETDIAVLYGKGVWAGAKAAHLMEGACHPVCSGLFLEKAGDLRAPERIMGVSLLHDTARSAWQKWFKAAGIAAPDVSAGPIFEDFNLLRSAALAGHGVALAPPTLIADDLAAGRLVRLSDVSVFQSYGYYVLEPEDSDPRKAAAADTFKRWLFAAARRP
jgi:LysR family transcriptional regulator, glycine cleavage system transcriptional activator